MFRIIKYSDSVLEFVTRLRLFLIFAFLFGAAAGVRGANWYVDSAATSGLNNGTSWANAWTNLDAINTIRPKFLASGVKGGDTVYISGGVSGQTYTVSNGASYLVLVGPAPTNHVTYCSGVDAGHNGAVIFDGQGQVPFCMGQGLRNVTISGNIIVTNYPNLAIYGDGSSSARVDGLTIYGSIRFIGGSTDIILANCFIQAPNNQDFVISWGVMGSTNTFPYTNASIYNCMIMGARQNDSSGFGSDLIQFSGGGYSVYSNLFTTYFVSSFTEGQHQDAMQTSGATSDIQIYDNVFQNMANYMIFWSPFQSVPQTNRNVFIYNNIFQENAPMTNDTGYTLGIAFSMQGGPGGTMLFSNIVIANNTFVDLFGRGAMGMGMNGTQTNFYIVNNLLYNCGSRNADGTVANTAIGIGGGSAGWSKTGLTMQYNEIEAGSLGNNSCNPGQSIAPPGLSTVPFVSYKPVSPANDLHLALTDIAARGQGQNLTALFPFLARDKDGNSRPSTGPWDIGAYQFTTGDIGTNALNPPLTDNPSSDTTTNPPVEVTTNAPVVPPVDPPTNPPVDTTITNIPPVIIVTNPPVVIVPQPPVSVPTNPPVITLPNPPIPGKNSGGKTGVSRLSAPSGFRLVFQ